MNKKELIKRLKKECNLGWKDGKDAEDNHIHADDLLLEYINDEEVTKAFEEIERWYS